MSESDRIRIGNRIKRRRLELGLSVRKLSDICGVPFNSISRIENGNWSASIDIISQICSALNLRIDLVDNHLRIDDPNE